MPEIDYEKLEASITDKTKAIVTVDHGGIPVFIDTEYDTWNMDPEALEKALDMYPEVKLIVVAHMYGTLGKIDEIRTSADKHGVLIVVYAAESFQSTYKSIQTGCFGDVSILSGNGNKIITGPVEGSC